MTISKKTLSLLALLMATFMAPSLGFAQFNWPYHIEKGQAVTDVPQREAGQKNVLNLTTPKMSVVRV